MTRSIIVFSFRSSFLFFGCIKMERQASSEPAIPKSQIHYSSNSVYLYPCCTMLSMSTKGLYKPVCWYLHSAHLRIGNYIRRCSDQSSSSSYAKAGRVGNENFMLRNLADFAAPTSESPRLRCLSVIY